MWSVGHCSVHWLSNTCTTSYQQSSIETWNLQSKFMYIFVSASLLLSLIMILLSRVYWFYSCKVYVLHRCILFKNICFMINWLDSDSFWRYAFWLQTNPSMQDGGKDMLNSISDSVKCRLYIFLVVCCWQSMVQSWRSVTLGQLLFRKHRWHATKEVQHGWPQRYLKVRYHDQVHVILF